MCKAIQGMREEERIEGLRVWKDANGAEWSFENCLCPRYTTPDEQGNVILDYCYFICKEEANK